MVNVSKQPIRKELSHSLFRQLAECVVRTKSSKKSEKFLRALLTESEETMLAKRLAVILLLNEERFTANRIANMLHMSPTTVGEMEERYRQGDYDAIMISIGQAEKDREELWKSIGIVLRLGLPPRAGKERVKWAKHFHANHT